MIDSTETKYTLANNWILREDPYFKSKEYSIYDIYSRSTLYITRSCYTLLKIFSRAALSFSEINRMVEDKNCKIDWDGFKSLCKKIAPLELLVKSQVPIRQNDTPISGEKMSGYDVPVASTPFGVEMHLTHKCNLSCSHCFQSSSPHSSLFSELSEDTWFDVFEQLEACKIQDVMISGGEPLYYSHFSSLFNSIVNKRLHYTILTNGTLVNSGNVEALSEENVLLSISLDGYTEEMHDKIRGKGAYKKLMKAINLLVEHGAWVTLAYTINSYNYLYLKELFDLACTLHVKGVTLGFTDRIGRAKDNSDLVLSVSQREFVKQNFAQLQQEYGERLRLNLVEVASIKPSTPISDKVYCSAGTIRVGISADGHIYPCVYGFGYEELIMGDLTKEKLKDIWENRDRWKMFRGGFCLEKIDTCATCALNRKCAMRNCRLRNYAQGQSFYNKPIECAIDYSVSL